MQETNNAKDRAQSIQLSKTSTPNNQSQNKEVRQFSQSTTNNRLIQ